MTLDRSRSVVVEDLSPTGARLRGKDLPQDGDELLIKVGLLTVLASVAWSSRDECGITFEHPLDPCCLDQFKHEGEFGRIVGII